MLASLERAREHLAAAARRLPGLQLRVICDRAPELPGMRVVPRRWSSAGEAAELAAGDVAVSWLPDDTWSRGKCGLKVLQYMAAALPVVANPVGMNRRMVVHGRTGLLASTPQQWAEAVGRLAADPQLRRRDGIGRAANGPSVATPSGAWSERFADVVQSMVCGVEDGMRRVAGAKHSGAPGEQESGASLRSATSHPEGVFRQRLVSE